MARAPRTTTTVGLGLGLSLALLAGCAGEGSEPGAGARGAKGADTGSVGSTRSSVGEEQARGVAVSVPAGYAVGILDARRAKDAEFRTAQASPVPSEQRASFHGLDYYPVDPSWRLVLPLEPDRTSRPMTVTTNLGERRKLRRQGSVRFERDGRTVSLGLYRFLDDASPDNALWLAFVDGSAGSETYPGGRFLDTELGPDGRVVLDFNLAYNPYCAYGWAYSCPAAPPENHLAIPIRAGERGFKKGP